MPPRLVKGWAVWLGGLELDNYVRAAEISVEVDELDVTPVTSTSRVSSGGLQRASVSLQVLQDYSTNIDQDLSSVGSSTLLTVIPDGNVAGSVCYSVPIYQLTYEAFGEVGEPHIITVTGAPSGDRVVRGSLALAMATRTAGGSGSGVNLGQVAADKRVYAGVHVVAYTAGTWTINIESDDNSSFSSPVTQLTFSGINGRGSYWNSKAGPITDTWWRVSWSVTGTSPSARFGVIIGIR